MFPFIAIAALIIGVGNMTFHQGQANPQADGFLDSKSSASK